MNTCLNSMMAKDNCMIAILFFEMFDEKKIAVLRTAPLTQAGFLHSYDSYGITIRKLTFRRNEICVEI